MPLVWVTGVSGSGKSSVCEVLKARGHMAIDADMEGYSHWVDRETGEVAAVAWSEVQPGWLSRYAWWIDAGFVESLAGSAPSSVAFLCGNAENEGRVWQYFDQVVCLAIDDNTLRHRLATRTTNDFGKYPDQLDAALKTNAIAENRYRSLGATILDATRPLDVLVRELLILTVPDET